MYMYIVVYAHTEYAIETGDYIDVTLYMSIAIQKATMYSKLKQTFAKTILYDIAFPVLIN